MLRHPAVAGHFYKGSPEALRKQIQEFISTSHSKLKALGVLVPHAGLVYSGSVAGEVYSRVVIPDSVVLIGPNHTGLGTPISIMVKGQWETPLGVVDIDDTLASSILQQSPHIREDHLAHMHEHSLEVQIPFLQQLRANVKIVPIQMLDTRFETCVEVGRAVAAAIRGQAGKDSSTLIVASSDMSHYEQASVANEKDHKAIQAILKLDPEGLYQAIRRWGITMCGYGPCIAMLTASKILGATDAELIRYTNSGEVSGDFDQVVGYAGIVIV